VLPSWTGSQHDAYNANSHYNVNEHSIQGRMFQARLNVDELSMLSEDDIKHELTRLLTDTMFKEKHISFTKQVDPMLGRTTYHARIFATPDSTTRVVRELLKNNT